jgi:hypothetical protein
MRIHVFMSDSMQSTFQLLYKTVNSRRKKERFETILEPLQAILQIALLAFYPVGTKVTIQNNALILQPPAYSQSMLRWYNNDTKEDLYFLFNVFTRFKKFYAPYKGDAPESVQHRLYALLIDLSKTGINKLIRTYGQTDKPHILQTLTMYKFILDDQLSPDIMPLPPNATNSKPYKMKPILNNDDDDEPKSSEMSSTNNTVDDIFISIVGIYTPELLSIAYNTLLLIRDNESNYAAYADGLNKIMEPTCVQVKKWIDEHIVY